MLKLTKNCILTYILVDQEIKNHLNDDVDDLKAGRRLRVSDEGTESIEKWLQTHPAELANRVAEEARLEVRGDVSVLDFITLVPMVLEMVNFEADREWQHDGQICKHAKHPIQHRLTVAKRLVVRYFMNGCRQKFVVKIWFLILTLLGESKIKLALFNRSVCDVYLPSMSEWLMTPPMQYEANIRIGQEKSFTHMTTKTWRAIIPRTVHLKFGSWPNNFLIWGYLAEIMIKI